jgi:hypothetical protein
VTTSEGEVSCMVVGSVLKGIILTYTWIVCNLIVIVIVIVIVIDQFY